MLSPLELGSVEEAFSEEMRPVAAKWGSCRRRLVICVFFLPGILFAAVCGKGRVVEAVNGPLEERGEEETRPVAGKWGGSGRHRQNPMPLLLYGSCLALRFVLWGG